MKRRRRHFSAAIADFASARHGNPGISPKSQVDAATDFGLVKWPPAWTPAKRRRQRLERHPVAFRSAPHDIRVAPANNSAEMKMPEGDGASLWDFLTLATLWSLYGLPLLLLATGAFILVKKRRLDRSNLAEVAGDGRRVVRIVALIHLGLGLHGAVLLVQELLKLRVMGVPESFATLVIETLAVIVNPPLALGLWLARRGARWSAIAWYLFLAVLGVVVARWLWHYGVAIEPRSWPNHLAGKLMPFFLLVVMFLPRVKRVFARPKKKTISEVALEAIEPGPEKMERWSIVSLICLLFLIVVVSNFAVDAADWIERSVSEWNQTGAP
jgi:hypothetical protein